MDSSSLPISICELSVLFTDDSEIQQLNFEYRKKNKATDVLSFSAIEGLDVAEFETNLGDLVISLETASRQAAELSVSLAEEVFRLLAHGILHLFGYDHENVPKSEILRMQTEEDHLASLFLAEFTNDFKDAI